MSESKKAGTKKATAKKKPAKGKAIESEETAVEKPEKVKRARKHMDEATFEKLEAADPNVLTRKEKLALIVERKRRLAEEQKAIREELDANKEERAEARKERAEARKAVMTEKQKLHKLSTSVAATVKDGDSEKLEELADDLMEAATSTAASLRRFSEVIEALDEL